MSPELTNGMFAIAGAVVGAVLTGAMTNRHSDRTRPKKELTITSKNPGRLVEVNERFSKDVEVRVAGRIVPTVYVVDLGVENTGNEVLTDVVVPVSFESEGELVAVSLLDSSFARGADDCAVEQTGTRSCVVRAKYLNPADRLNLRVLLSGPPHKYETEFRQPGVRHRQRYEADATEVGVVADAVYQAVRRNPFLSLYFLAVVPAYRRRLVGDKTK